MKCNRCGGLMVHENFYTLEIANLHEWRCVPCGEIVDEVILENRNTQGGGDGRRLPGDLARNGRPLLKKKTSIPPHYHHA